MAWNLVIKYNNLIINNIIMLLFVSLSSKPFYATYPFELSTG